MIETLIDAAVARLREELADLLPAPERQVVAGPVADPAADALPLVALSPGRLRIGQSTREGPAGAPRPQPATERIRLDPERPGPYPLSHTPLEGTVHARLVLSPDTIAERGELLAAGKDFTVDPRNATVTLAVDLPARIAAHAAATRAGIQARAGREFNVDSPEELSGVLFDELGLPPQGERTKSGYYSTAADVLQELAGTHPIAAHLLVYRGLQGTPSAVLKVDYSFAGLFTVREFEQSLLVDVYEAGGAGTGRLGSLAAGVLLTWQDELRGAAEVEHATRRSVSTSHRITRLDFVDGVPEAFAGGRRMRLSFQVTGQMKLMREAAGSFGIIERIQSPGSTAPGPVSLAAELG